METFQSNSNQSKTLSLSSLVCEETNISFDEEGIDKYSPPMNIFDHDHDEEYVKMLFDKEISYVDDDQIQEDPLSRQRQQVSGNDWIKEARLDAIQYTLNMTTMFGFNWLTAYNSIMYLDTFLSIRHINGDNIWAMRLLGVACISLAAKMEEYMAPSLLELTTEEYNFDSEMIQRMELLVLSTLEWKMITITPFPFIHFFIPRLCEDSPPKNIESRISELIFRLIQDVNLMSYKQSVIAAAMTLMALDPSLSKEEMEKRLHGLSSSFPLNIEEVWSCYKEMEALDTKRLNKSSNSIISTPFSPTQFPNTNALEYPSSSTTPAIGSKRKRLGFNECDQNSDNFPSNDEKKRQT